MIQHDKPRTAETRETRQPPFPLQQQPNSLFLGWGPKI
jgi:hypothetical protein